MVNTRVTSTLLKVMFALTLVTLLVLPVVAVAAAAGTYSYLTRDFPSPGKLSELTATATRSTFIYDRNGSLLYESFDPEQGRHMSVTLADLPTYVIEATLAVEDPNFYDNPGFDPRHILRAVLQNLQSGSIRSGASTITQQLVRNVFFDEAQRYEQSYTRKAKEAILAFQISQYYSKDEILQTYLNEIWYGNLAYGIESASWSFFNKHARELSLAEAALLVGLPQAPNAYNPYTAFKAAKERQAVVLDRMVINGYITETEAEEAKSAPLALAPRNFELHSPHFVFYVLEQLREQLGDKRMKQGGLRVYTSLDPKLQEMALESARDHIATIRDRNANNAAMVVIDPRTAEILAMVGSVDYWDETINGQINMATTDRQPGSTLKPLTYVTAFEKLGWGPATIIVDEKTDFPDGANRPPYSPNNHDMQFRGPVTVRAALAPSLNVPAVKALQAIGLPSLLDTAHRMGITSLRNEDNTLGLAVTLGGGEVKLVDLVYAYTVFANNGLQVGEPVPEHLRQSGMRELGPVSVVRVTDEMGNTIAGYQPNPGVQVLSPQASYMITDILSDDVARSPTYGLNSFLDIGRPAAAKTGTTDNYRDGWTVGYTPQMVVGVWVGNADNTPMKDVYGVSGAGYIWGNFMKKALANEPPISFTVPDSGIIKATTCSISGNLATAACPTKVEDWHFQDKVPRESCTLHIIRPTPIPTLTPTPSAKPTAPAAGTPAAGNTPAPGASATPGQPPANVTPAPAAPQPTTQAPAQPAPTNPPAPEAPPATASP